MRVSIYASLLNWQKFLFDAINSHKVYHTLTDPKEAGHYNIKVSNDAKADQFEDAVTFFKPDEYFLQK